MQKAFQNFIKKHQLSSSHPVLIGVSGGRDSVVLCDLFHSLKIPFAIGHCHFGLRGEESDEDEYFVSELAKKYKVAFHSVRLTTKKHAIEQGISIQMAARALRIEWSKKLCESFHYEYYATAHHQDDAIETYLINQIRGTGISGLHGILPKQGNTIHPLLFASREEVTFYAISHNLDWREDSSNQQTKYLRNKVRHQVLPMLQDINGNIKKILLDNMKRIHASEQIYKAKIEECKKEMTYTKQEEMVIELDKLLLSEQAPTLLFEMIKDYGFNYAQCQQIIPIDEESSSGAMIYSNTHALLRDRDELLIKKASPIKHPNYEIEEGIRYIETPLSLSIEPCESLEIFKHKNSAQFDLDRIQFPLTLRKWQMGDYFYPIGMKGQKKLLSDYFIDQKLTVFEKEHIWLLCSEEEIIWVIGHRMDNRFKIRAATKKSIKISLLDPDC